MEHRLLGASGLKVPVLSLGTGTFGGSNDFFKLLFRVVDALDEVAKETGKTVAQIALNWVASRPGVSTVIMGARNEEQLRANLGAVGWSLTVDQVAKLDAASAVPMTYPYWHQAQFTERNPFPVK